MTDLRVFVIGQETSKGFLYFNGKAHPVNPDAWTKSIHRAKRLTWKELCLLRETYGVPLVREALDS